MSREEKVLEIIEQIKATITNAIAIEDIPKKDIPTLFIMHGGDLQDIELAIELWHK